LLERLPVVGAGFRGAALLGVSLGCCFCGDVEELFPGDDATSSSAVDAPPWRVIFGMGCPCSIRSVE